MRRGLLALLILLLVVGVAGAQTPTFQRATGSITTAGTDCTVATRCVVMPFAARTANGTIQLAGSFTGTAQFEGSIDEPVTSASSWFTLNVLPNGSTSFVTSATNVGTWTIPMALTGVRVRASALSAGSMTVRMIVTSASRGGSGAGAGGGAGTSAGANNDVQIGDGAGGFKVDTGNFAMDPAVHDLKISGCYTISGDAFLCRTAANALAVANGTAAQTLHVYGTTTGPRRLTFAHSGTRASISSGTDPIDLTATTIIPVSDKGVDQGDATHRFKNSYTVQPVVPINAAGNSGAAITINWTNGARQSVTMTGDATFTLSNPIAGGTYYLFLLEDGTGSRAPTWPVAVKWSGGTAPTLSGAAKTDIIALVYDGTSYFGSYVLNF